MNVSPLQTDASPFSLGSGAANPSIAAGSAPASFDQMLSQFATGSGEDEVRRTAEQLVATAFIAPVLKDIRENSQAEEPFAPTPAEKQFGALLDTKTAEEIVRSANLPIVDRLTDTFLEISSRGSASESAQQNKTALLGRDGVLA